MPSESFPEWSGAVLHLHSCPRSFLPMQSFSQLELIAGVGVRGDRYMLTQGYYSDKPEEGRQVTLFEQETLNALLRDHEIVFLPEEHRRNITTIGVPLNHLVGRRFRVGSVLLEAQRLSTPCKHLEEITGKPVFNPLINRCGLNCRILTGGIISIGDRIRPDAS